MRMPSGRMYWPVLFVVLAACSNGSGSLEDQPAPAPPPPPPPSQPAQTAFSISGSVGGLTGSGLVLQNNGAGDLPIASDGSFAFATTVATGAAYNVTILTQPTTPAQTCTIANGTGTVANSDITNIVVTCTAAPRFTIGGIVTGLTGTGLVLQNNAADNRTIVTNGDFSFTTALTSGTAYNVTVATQPNGQNCVVRNPSGTVASANVTNVEVACAANQFTVGGSVSGLAGSGLVLQLNGGSDLSVVRDGTFAFPAALATNAAYAVTVKASSPVLKPAQDCVVTRGAGTIAGANVTNVAVACTTKTFPVGGEIAGLQGSGLVLQLNNANDLTVQGNGSFAFPAIPSGTAYTVEIRTPPTAPPQDCTLANERGVVEAAAVTTVRITCATRTYSVGGTVIGLATGASLVLQNNASNDLTITRNGRFNFSAPIASGSAYKVTVLRHPANPTQACSLTNDSGTIGAGNVEDVVVTCSTTNFALGGTVNNLVGAGLVLRNGAERLAITMSGAFQFPRTVPSGSTYDVQIEAQPMKPQQTCTLDGTSGTGTVGGANVTSIVVNCVTDGFTIGGNVTGLRSPGLTIQNNQGDDVSIAADGPFTFPTPLPEGAMYNVTISQPPLNPTNFCFVISASGTVATQDVTNVQISCL